MPEHEAIVAAVTDPELSRWVSDRRGYLLKPADLSLGTNPIWRVTATEISHPLSFYLVDLGGGTLVVTSGHIDGIAAIVRRDSALFDGPKGAELLAALAAPTIGAATLVSSDVELPAASIAARAAIDPPKIGRASGRWEAELFVVDDLDRLRKWRIVVPDVGAPSWDQQTIAHDVGVRAEGGLQ